MTTSIHTGTYYLDIRAYNSDAVHLYEHLLIRTFEMRLVEAGFSPYLYGWIGGETFRNAIFLDFGLYHPDVVKLFHDFMSGASRIDSSLIDIEITRIEAEMLANITITTKDDLRKKLSEVDGLAWQAIEQPQNEPLMQMHQSVAQVSPNLWSEKRSKKSFKHVTVVVGLENPSIEEKAVFLRMTPIVFDAINNKLYNHGLYQNGNSWPVYHSNSNGDAMTGHSIFTMRRGSLTLKELEVSAREAVTGISLDGRSSELKYYLEGFTDTATWNSFPINYFRYSGLLVSRGKIKELATLDMIGSIVAKLKVQVVNTIQEHWDVC